MKHEQTISLALLVLTTGCEEHKISKGVVVDKMMTPTRMSFIVGHQATVPIIHPATYRVSVKDNGIIETFWVDELQYSSVCVGDSIKF